MLADRKNTLEKQSFAELGGQTLHAIMSVFHGSRVSGLETGSINGLKVCLDM